MNNGSPITNFLKVADEKHEISFHWPNGVSENGELLNWCYRLDTD